MAVRPDLLAECGRVMAVAGHAALTDQDISLAETVCLNMEDLRD